MKLSIGHKRILILALTPIGITFINNSVSAENDWQYWSQYEVSISVNDNVDLKVKPEFRYKDDFRDYYYSHIEAGLDWKVKDWFIGGAYYRYINEEKNDDWQIENRPHLDATFKWKFSSLSLSDRNMVEYHIKEDKEFFRYRNKLTIKFPKFTSFNIQPYIAEEPFYDFDVDEWNKNRLYGGVDFKIVQNLTGSVYYILESSKSGDDWNEVNVLATKLKYTF
jgi:hypothetical protein